MEQPHTPPTLAERFDIFMEETNLNEAPNDVQEALRLTFYAGSMESMMLAHFCGNSGLPAETASRYMQMRFDENVAYLESNGRATFADDDELH